MNRQKSRSRSIVKAIVFAVFAVGLSQEARSQDKAVWDLVLLSHLRASAESAEKAGDREEPLLSELRVGLLYHDAIVLNRDFNFSPFNQDQEEGVDLSLSAYLRTPELIRALGIGEIRPYASASINLVGDTSLAVLGLDWGTQTDFGLFFGLFAGLGVHSGAVDSDGDPDTKEFGSRFTPQYGLEVGYRLAESPHGLSLRWEHHSHNNWFGEENDALDNWGLRYSYRY